MRIIWLNLILEWDGLLRTLHRRPDKPHWADIELFQNGHQKIWYALNWAVYKIICI